MKPVAACFTDFRIIPSRKLARITVEIPIEAANEALASLGGFPNPSESRWLALAPLNVRSQRAPEKPKGGTLARQAGMTCTEASFRTFIGSTEGGTADYVREYCGVRSRAELDSNPDAAERWKTLLADYEQWQREQAA